MIKKQATPRPRSVKPAKATDRRRIDALSDRESAATVASDPDAAPIITPTWHKKAKLVAPKGR